MVVVGSNPLAFGAACHVPTTGSSACGLRKRDYESVSDVEMMTLARDTRKAERGNLV